jgi:hypothetical protein
MGLGVLVGVSLMIVLTLAAALALRRRNRVDRQRDETPEDRYRREARHLRPTDGDSWRGRRYGSGGSDSSPSSYP